MTELKNAKPKKVKRGKPSSIDLIPEDLRLELVKALKEKRLSQKDILEAFNKLLKERTEPIISKSALNRYAQKITETAAMLQDAKETANVLVGKLGAEDSNLGRALAEMIQSLAFNIVLNGEVSVDTLSQLALLTQRLESAGKIGIERELKILENFKKEQIDKLVDAEKRGDIKKEAMLEARRILGFE